MKKPPTTSRLREAWVLFFFLGVVMLNYPFLQIVNKTSTFLGIPLLVLYFLLGWPASIAVIYLFSRRLKNEHPATNGQEKGEG
jgi:hypothetical protein